MTRYPPDEFDEVPESVDRQGVHRERLVPAGSSGPMLKVLVGVLVLLVGLAAYFLVPRLGLDSGPGAERTPAAADLGIAAVVLDPDVAPLITVVLEPDFQ